MARPPSKVNQDEVSHTSEVVLTNNAFGMFKDVDGRWYVAVIGYNPLNPTHFSFKRANNFFIPEQMSSADDKFESFEHFKKHAGEEFFGED